MSAMQPVLQRWQSRWQAIPRPQQRMLLTLLLCLISAILWVFVYAPLQASRVHNTKRIAQLQQDYTRMQQDAAAYQQLKSLPPVVATNATVTLAEIAALENMFGVGSKVSMNASGVFRIDSTGVRYQDWLGKLDQAASRYRLSVRELDIRRSKNDAFNISAVLSDKPSSAGK